MCGVCGIWHYGTGAPAEQAMLDAMKATLERRGPDDEGTYLDGALGLGFRRLAIVDLSGGHQPMSNARGDLWLVFNGEIYNHHALRAELQARGCQFRTRSDTEVLLYAYQEYGAACLDKLRGMFAFVVWDRQQQSLFAARDRFGIKPFYYHDDGERLVFASELKALRLGLTHQPALNTASLERYFTYRYVPGPDTMWQGVHKLQPGHCLTRTRSTSRLEAYWQPRFGDGAPTRPLQDYIEEARALLLETVKLHLDADVPLGVLLSGGLDSSTILALAKHLEPQALKAAFSVGFKDFGPEDETGYAAEAARHFGIEHVILRIDEQEYRDGLTDFVWQQDEPLADPTGLPLYLICRKAKETVTVLLSGEGADEIFAGYDRYKPARLMALSSALPPVRGLAHWLTTLFPAGSYPFRLSTALAGRDRAHQWQAVSSLTSPALRGELLESPINRTVAHADLLARLQASLAGIPNPLNQLQKLDLQMWLPDNMLTKKDRMTMAASIEARVPFLDHKLAEFGLGLPPSLRLHGMTGKWIIRQAMADLLPAANVRRRKTGWPIPLDRWFQHQMKSLAGDVLLSPQTRHRGLFNPATVERILHEHWAGKARHGRLIFLLLCAELWCRAYT